MNCLALVQLSAPEVQKKKKFLREVWSSFLEEGVATVQRCLRWQTLLDAAGQPSGAVPWQHSLREG